MTLLQDMLDMQLDLQKVMPPTPDRATNPDPQTSCEYIKDNVTACTAELFELLEETGWKPWSSSWHVDVEKCRKEWIDAWHFLMNLANKLDMTETMIYRMYVEKHEVNRQRQVDGYDGVSTKCPQCNRELDTRGALALEQRSNGPRTVCTGCSHEFNHVELAALAMMGVVAPEGP